MKGAPISSSIVEVGVGAEVEAKLRLGSVFLFAIGVRVLLGAHLSTVIIVLVGLRKPAYDD